MARKLRKRNRKGGIKWLKGFLILMLIGLIAIVSIYLFKPELLHRFETKVERLLSPKSHSNLIETSVVEEEILPVKPRGTLQKDILIKHQIAAKRAGVLVIEDEKELETLIARNKLLVVEEGIGYTLEDMSHSYTYLTPNAKRILQKIALSFYEYSGNHSTMTVTSLTRTEGTQKKLRRSNRNATTQESTHTRGVSFDISYIRYNGKKDWNDKLTKVLEGVLAAMQANGEIYVIKERKQSCFHITVRK